MTVTDDEGLTDDNPFDDAPEPEPVVEPPTSNQLRTIMDSYVVLAVSRIEKVQSKKEASATISAVMKEVREVRGGLIPKRDFLTVVWKAVARYYGR
jgi:hypothetical protein